MMRCYSTMIKSLRLVQLRAVVHLVLDNDANRLEGVLVPSQVVSEGLVQHGEFFQPSVQCLVSKATAAFKASHGLWIL